MKHSNFIRTLFSILFFLLFSFKNLAQDDVENLLLNGIEDLEAKKYHSALHYLSQALKIKPKHQEALYYSGICYFRLSMPQKAIDTFKKVHAEKLSKGDNFNYWFAQSYFLIEDFDHAEQYLTSYMDRKQQPLLADAKRLQTYMANARKFYNEESLFTVENLGKNINTQYDEFSPCLNQSQTTLLFTTNRSNSTQLDLDEPKKYAILSSKINHNGTFEKAEMLFPRGIRHKKAISLQILADELVTNAKRILLTREGELILSELRNGKWVSDKLDTQILKGKIKGIDAFLSHDGKILFFSSKSKSNGKNAELYVIYLQEDGSWTRPKAIDKLNSKQNNCSPFLSPDGKTFYFSSQGHDSMGGYDIFKANFDAKTRTFSGIENLKYPLNSVADEMSFSFKGEVGYFSSNRIGGKGKMDIYRVFFFDKMILAGEVRDFQTNETQGNTLVRLMDTQGEMTQVKTNQEGQYALALPANGIFKIQLIKEEKLRYVQTLKLSALQVANKSNRVFHQNFYFNITAQKAQLVSNPEAITHFNKIQKGKVFRLRFVYFETGSAKLKEKSIPELQNLAKFLIENPQIEIEIRGHTDNVGKVEANQLLSQRRAESVQGFLILKENSLKNRVKAKGYGDSIPLVSNDDEKEGREINRRIEVKILN